MQRLHVLRWWGLGLVLSLAVSLAQAQSNNLLLNPGFESGLTGWSFSPSTAQVTLVSTAHSGTQAVALSKSSATGWVRVWQRVPVTPGTSYQLTGWVLWNDTALTNAKLQVRWRDSSGPLGGYVEVSAPARSSQYQPLALGPLTAPSGAVEAEITCYTYVNTPAPAQPLLCDDFWFGPVGPAATPTASPTAAPTATATPSPTLTASPPPTFTPTPTPSPTASTPSTPTSTPTSTNTPTPTSTATPSPTSTPTATPAPTSTPTVPPLPTPTSTPWPERAVLISEVAWAGTLASPSDEWIELHNPNPFAISLDGWVLRAQDGTPLIALSGTIAAGGFFLLERTDDQSVADVPADLIYTTPAA